MNVRQLIKALADEDDIESTVYVRIVGEDGDEKFFALDGIALTGHSYRESVRVTCTTLELDYYD